MGFNTTIVILNDSLNEIREDKDFGEKLYGAIMENWQTKKPTTIFANGKNGVGDCGVVITQYHSSADIMIRVGGNTGEVIKRYVK